jgi:hypothetical protein
MEVEWTEVAQRDRGVDPVVHSPDSFMGVCSYSASLCVLIYRVVILSDKNCLSLPASTALHVRAVG